MALTQVNAGLIDSTSQPNSFKNRIINGAMMIDQRNAGASVTSGYPVDRFFTQYGSGTLTFQQTTSIVPAGFSSALGITVTSAGTRNAGDYYGLLQIIEGYNIADFNEGTANAQTFTLSFWVRSSVSGLYSGAIRSGDNNRSYVFTYTINATNTWQYVTATVVGDTGGTTSNWPTNNSSGLRLCFDLGTGSTYQQTAGSWQANANKFGASGTVGWAQTAGATFYITGVQLEKGSTATSFDYRPYGTELMLCQRYFVKWVGDSSGVGFPPLGSGCASGSNSANIVVGLPVTMRANPTLGFSGLVSLYTAASGGNLSAIGTTYASGPSAVWFSLATSTGSFTIGDCAVMYVQNASTNYFTASSEL